MVKKTIFVSDISSIKHNHFSFKNKKDVIKEYPFVVKTAPDGSSYHFDQEDLAAMSNYEKDLAPHDEKDRLTKTEYIGKMKQEFYHQIRSGNMDEILAFLYKMENKDFELKWEGMIKPKFKT
ncbi:hypothetical protein SAMN04487975_10457 [Planococcus glaciei]|nr:hypothetical protein SAMN04487975_10457 [Planococcus glaciei]